MIDFFIFIPFLIVLATGLKIRSWQFLRLILNYVVVGSIIDIIILGGNISGIGLWAIMGLLVLLEGSNLEHIISNGSNQSITFVRFIYDPVFLRGSGLSKRFFIRLSVFILMAIATLWLTINLSLSSYFLILGTSLLFSLIIPKTINMPDWAQESWHFFNLRYLFFKGIKRQKSLAKNVVLNQEKLASADQQYKAIVKKDEGQERWLVSKKKNVLLIMVEGLGQTHLDQGLLPSISKWSKRAVTTETFISHQRNTNRGVYSLLTGKHPNIFSQIAKPDLVAQYGKIDEGLADFLGEKGYRTLFIQGAPTRFMSKDRFLTQIGFKEVIGEEHFDKSIPRIKWGLDDKHLYQQCLSKIDELNQSAANWFMSVLTVSTHHPYQACDERLITAEDAFKYADRMIGEFLNQLEKRNILENTLVLITSDEVAGDSDNLLSHNLGLLTIMVPEKISRKLTIPFCQSDMAFSICDYLGLDDHPFVGRSVFRQYEVSRPLFFGNIFQQKSYCYDKGKLFIKNYTGKDEKFLLPDFSLNTKLQRSTIENAEEMRLLNDFIHANDKDLEFLTAPVVVDIKEILPTAEERVQVGGSIKVGMKKGEKLCLRFDGSSVQKNKPVILLWMVKDMKNRRTFKLNSIMLPGTVLSYSKEFISPDDAWYDLKINVLGNGEEGWKVENLQVTLES